MPEPVGQERQLRDMLPELVERLALFERMQAHDPERVPGVGERIHEAGQVRRDCQLLEAREDAVDHVEDAELQGIPCLESDLLDLLPVPDQEGHRRDEQPHAHDDQSDR